MQARDAVFLEDLCPKLRVRRWRQSLHLATDRRCIYCGERSESIDHVHPQSRGGLSVTENCVPACLPCNGDKGDANAFEWYRRQAFVALADGLLNLGPFRGDHHRHNEQQHG
jgi:5-methylcytosine-specific restriction endonuclease McrA